MGNSCVHGKNEKMKKNKRHEKWNATLLRKPSTIDIQNSKYKKIKKKNFHHIEIILFHDFQFLILMGFLTMHYASGK